MSNREIEGVFFVLNVYQFVKTVTKNMAKYELKFLDIIDQSYIKVEKQENTEQYWIQISVYEDGTENESKINLDKSTAIKFSKALRTEINKITESEAKND